MSSVSGGGGGGGAGRTAAAAEGDGAARRANAADEEDEAAAAPRRAGKAEEEAELDIAGWRAEGGGERPVLAKRALRCVSGASVGSASDHGVLAASRQKPHEHGLAATASGSASGLPWLG